MYTDTTLSRWITMFIQKTPSNVIQRQETVYRAPLNGEHGLRARHLQPQTLKAGDGEVGGLEVCCRCTVIP